MTKREAAIITAYTGSELCNLEDFHSYVEELLGRPVLMHEIPELENEIKEKSKKDVLLIAENNIRSSKEKSMEDNIIYIDAKGFQYVKGDIGGGYTVNWDGGYYHIDQNKLWDYCDVPEEVIVRFCKNTKIKFNI